MNYCSIADKLGLGCPSITLIPIFLNLHIGPEGLGFTVVTRDSSVHEPGPILVKNILPRGAAVKDGRLQSGDRILEVSLFLEEDGVFLE